MRALIGLMVALPLLAASPALAQSMDHASMPGMQMPAEPTAKPAPKPASKAKAKPKAKAKAKAKPKTKAQAAAQTAAKPGSGGADMAGMDHGAMTGMDHGAMPDMPAGSPQPAAEPATDMPMDAGMDHSQMAGMGAEQPPPEEVGDAAPPPPATDHVADRFYDPAAMSAARGVLRREHGAVVVSKVMLKLGEFQSRDGEDGYRWVGEAWIGGDYNRFVFKTEGEGARGSGPEAAEVQGLYSRAISPFFDLQAGVRYDLEPRPRRVYATIGFEGLAPYWFDTEGALFLSDRGDVSARLEGSYDLRLTQRWVLQPRAEANLAAQDVPELGVGSGLSNLELGLRLRYEIKREFAPYVGVSWDRKFGGTADFARARGESTRDTSIVFGVRAWF